MLSIKLSNNSQHHLHQKGASLVEFVVVAPTLLFMMLGIVQAGMVFHAKSNLNYATFEAARAGSVGHGNVNTIRATFTRAMVGYYGGGRNAEEVAEATARATADITPTSLQIELLSPTKESFDDYASPKLAAKYSTKARVIPNNNLSAITCPVDKTSCNNNPKTNASGQTLSDANLLRIKLTYGIPAAKQMPLVGRFYVMVLQGLTNLGVTAETDPFKVALLAQGRIPMVVHTTMRMQSDPIENGNVSNPGPGNNGVPTDPPPVDPGTDPGDPGDGSDNGDGTDDIDDTPCDPTVDIECAPTPDPCGTGVVSEDLASDVLFDFDSATLTAAGKVALDKMISTLNAEKANTYRTDEIFITGYADKIGDDAYNLNLSQARAEAVQEYLQQHLDDDVEVAIKAEGKGELDPKTSDGVCTEEKTESNKANCAPDRRVNITRKLATFEAP
jgi:outer membrane protein OmpA-like peptidoglycan-associated protein/Flp pilus assembly protein TadG